MNIREISKPVTAAALNESLARRFGQRVKLENFTLEQLQDARNKLRTALSQVETNESYDSVSTNEVYQKNRLFLDVLNAEITEREDVVEASKPDYIDLDGDGDKEEPMKKAAKDKKMKGLKKNESIVREGAEDQAELVMAAKDMVDRITGWMEDTAEMQTESMLELGDAIRDEMGQEQSEQFINSVKPALESLYSTLEATRTSLTGGVAMLTGESVPAEPMGAPDEEGLDEPADEAGMEPTVDQEDEFAASEPAVGGDEEAGRARRESRQYKKAMIENSRKLGSILSKKK